MKMGTIICRFQGSATAYSYFADLDDASVKVGGSAVVETNDGMRVVTIHEIEKTINPNATKWIVGAVDDAAYRTRKQHMARIAEIRRDLSALQNKLPERRRYEYLALIDDKAETLLNEWLAIEEKLDEAGAEKHQARQAAE